MTAAPRSGETWRVYYADGSVHERTGRSAAAWRALPAGGVQVVVLMRPPRRPRWHYSGGLVTDRVPWTGTDTFDPFGWGAKTGTLITDAGYLAVWERACGD